MFRTRLENVILKIKVLDCGPLEEFLGRLADPLRVGQNSDQDPDSAFEYSLHSVPGNRSDIIIVFLSKL